MLADAPNPRCIGHLPLDYYLGVSAARRRSWPAWLTAVGLAVATLAVLHWLPFLA